MQSKRKGFTLIELLVVMAIIAVLVTMMVYAINSARMQSRNTQRRNTVKTAQAGLEAYYATKKSYPPTAQTVTDLLTNKSTDSTKGVADYAKGVTDGQRKDPNDEQYRMCYVQNGSNRYYMWVVPEPQDPPASCGTTIPADAEDFSVQ